MAALRSLLTLLMIMVTLLSACPPAIGAETLCIGKDGHVSIGASCSHCEDCDSGSDDCTDLITSSQESVVLPHSQRLAPAILVKLTFFVDQFTRLFVNVLTPTLPQVRALIPLPPPPVRSVVIII